MLCLGDLNFRIEDEQLRYYWAVFTSTISSFKRSVEEGVALKPCTFYFSALLIGTKKYAQLGWPSRPNNHYSRRHSEYKSARVKSFHFCKLAESTETLRGLTFYIVMPESNKIMIIIQLTLTHQLLS